MKVLKKWWFWVIVVVVIGGIGSAVAGTKNSSKETLIKCTRKAKNMV